VPEAEVQEAVVQEAVAQEALSSGVPGTSPRREFGRRRAKREADVRARHPRLGGLILAVTDEPQSTRTWEHGAAGEERLGARLDTVAGKGSRFCTTEHPGHHGEHRPRRRHRDRCPGHRRETLQGPPDPAVRGRHPVATRRTSVRGRPDCTKLVDGALRQVDLVRAAVEHADVPVTGALCFVDADWPIGRTFTIRGIQVLWPGRFTELLVKASEATVDVATIRGVLAEIFPPS
jgi:hypothetical protein